ncbi:xanthine dehydrogenase family protein molybdopterin-binding subunit [Sphingomonas sp.]|uniref:xanthine dehydrogenase family protein molybdopterin-binding subunit n=1 Tax=Sphingomonas sp. TaxID=28214 RepID=UPI002C7F3241|nr:xanthine dehydrogenase family protein molybdopterin-binding subunit [Sphingomonas sp.]HTG39190.1 xanthine dehydrogenase family protein molybdopterin-binding subunit [Sphingomonas sp.]
MAAAPFDDRARFDALEKVLGRTAFTADIPLPDMLYAMTVPATIAKGRIAAVPVEAAMAVPGVVRVLTAADFGPPSPPPTGASGFAAAPPTPTILSDIAYRGAPVALVLADSIEAAIAGAEAIQPRYAPAPTFAPVITSDGAEREPAEPVEAGDASTAMARAVDSVEVEYECPAQHHNPIELLSTMAVWSNGRLTVYDATQSAQTTRSNVARALGIDPQVVDVKSRYVGGGFGQKGTPQRQTPLIARAAMLTGRPVKLVMPRGQVFHNATFRPLSRHRIKIGADAAGKMVAIEYDADHQQSRTGQFPPEYHEAQPQMYGVADYHGTTANVRIDTQNPGYMRAPHPHPASFAFEGAVDELALKLGLDPVAFRLAHDTTIDPVTGRKLSSRFLNECIAEGAKRFGWDRRSAAPGSMTLADGTQVGFGVGCGAYPAITSANIATLRIGADGTTRFAVSAHEMGQGIRTVIAAALLRELDIDAERLELVIGDTSVVPQHVTAGSWGTASALPAIQAAAAKLKAAMIELLNGRMVSGNLHQQLATIRRPHLQVEVSTLAPGQDASALQGLRAAGFALAGPAYPAFTSFSYIAHFAEVHVEPRTRRIRVPRIVSVADCGRVVSPRTAASQVRGGVIWAIGSALREETEVDPRFGGWHNNDLADYVVPVNADVGEIDVAFIDRPDPLLNGVGAKGLGEVSMVGAAGAIGNAIFHATGRRLRRMPIRIEHLI